MKQKESMHSSKEINIYNDTMDKVHDAMSIALGYIPSIDISNPHNPKLSATKLTPSNNPLRQLYNTDLMAKKIIELICENTPELSLSKFDLGNMEN